LGRKTIQTVRDGRFEFVQQLVPCGKKNCRRCPHGPYWYARAWKGKTVREIYVGKSLAAWTDRREMRLLERLGRSAEREDLLEEAR
jgi:hypothetical protein